MVAALREAVVLPVEGRSLAVAIMAAVIGDLPVARELMDTAVMDTEATATDLAGVWGSATRRLTMILMPIAMLPMLTTRMLTAMDTDIRRMVTDTTAHRRSDSVVAWRSAEAGVDSAGDKAEII